MKINWKNPYLAYFLAIVCIIISAMSWNYASSLSDHLEIVDKNYNSLRLLHAQEQTAYARQETALNKQIAMLSQQVQELESQPGLIVDSKRARARMALPPTGVEAGLHVLEAEILVEKDGKHRKRKYTVYHLNKVIDVDGRAHSLQVGLAHAGISGVPQFYMDYDSDGKLDLEMTRDFIGYAPFGKFLEKTMDPDISQEIYATFVSNFHKSKKLSTGNEDGKDSGFGADLWNFVNERSSDIAAWIAKSSKKNPRRGGNRNSFSQVPSSSGQTSNYQRF